MSLEDVAAQLSERIDSFQLTKADCFDLILKALLEERRAQEAKARQQLHQVAPDLEGLQSEVSTLMSKVTRFGDESRNLQALVVRQRASNREDRYDLYRCIKALQAIDHPTAKEALGKIRPSVVKQMKTFKGP